MTRTLLNLHRWLGLVLGVLILLAALTAVTLNHRNLLEPKEEGLPASLYGRYLKDLAVNPAWPARMVAGADRGIFLSEDGGRTWAEVAGAEQVEDLEFDPERPDFAYAALRQGAVLRSRDGGRTWKPMDLPFGPEVQVSGLGVVPGAEPVLLTSRGVYRFEEGAWVLEPRPPEPQRDERGRALVKLAYNLHDGGFWGRWGVLVTDVTALGIAALVLTGWVLWFRRRPSKGRP